MILDKETHQKLEAELAKRYYHLISKFEGRELSSPSEGTKGGTWMNPELKTATIGDKVDIELAIDDFKTILNTMRKLK